MTRPRRNRHDHPDDPDGRVPEGDPEDFIPQDGLEIPEADEGGGIGFVEQVILGIPSQIVWAAGTTTTAAVIASAGARNQAGVHWESR